MRSSARTARRTETIARLMTLVGIALVMSACGGSSASTPGAGAVAAAPAGGADQPAASAGAAFGNGSQSAGNGQGAPLVDDTKIVRTGSLEMTVADTDKALLAGRDAIRALGGYIGASQQQRTNGTVVGTVTYRIPVTRWEDALTALRNLGTEVAEQTQAVEVTGQLVDLDARIRNLKASETALVGFAAQAPKTSDLLEIQARLTDTRGQIEQLTAQQATLSDQAALATLAVTFGTEVVAVTEAAARWDPAAQVDRASATLIGVGQAAANFLIVFAIVWLPILVVLAILGAIGLAIARRLGWRRPPGFPPSDPTAPVPPPAPAPAAEA
jgi:Domain of unknown function (DUF4349)